MKIIYHNLRYLILKSFIKLIIFTRLNFLVYFLFLNVIFSPVKRKISILYLSRSIFNEDIKNLQKEGNNIEFIKINSFIITFLFVEIFKKDILRNDIVENYLRYDDILFINKRKIYYRYLKIILNIYKKKYDFKCIIAGNFIYARNYEIFEVCKNLKIKSIILHKEGVALPNKINIDKMTSSVSKSILNADYIFFYNNLIYKSYLQYDDNNINEDNSFIFGVPRFDDYIINKNKFNSLDKNSVVFFAFNPIANFKLQFNDHSNLKKIEEITNEFYKNLFNYFKINKNYNLIIKSKLGNEHADFLNDQLKLHGFTRIPSNFTILNHVPAKTLLKKSNFIISCYSTVLIEAAILEKNILTLDYNKIGFNLDYFVNFQKLAFYYNKYEDFDYFLNNSQNKLSNNPEYLHKFVKQFSNSGLNPVSNKILKKIKEVMI